MCYSANIYGLSWQVVLASLLFNVPKNPKATDISVLPPSLQF